jgi:DNA repair exonuclease SbcCD nuclease subunit
VRGNHDGSFDYAGYIRGCPIETLQRDVVHFIDHRTDPIESRGFRDFGDEIRILGCGYYGHSAIKYLDKHILQNVSSERLNILILHSFVEGYTKVPPNQPAVPMDFLRGKGINYIVVGHDHQMRKPRDMDGTTLVCSGSTIKFDFEESGHEKGVYVVDVKSKGFNFDTLILREPIDLVKLSFSCEGRINRDDLLDQVKASLEEMAGGSRKLALKILISGSLDKGFRIRDVPIEEIKRLCVSCENVIYSEVLPSLSTSFSHGAEMRGLEGTFDLSKFLGKDLDGEVVEKLVKLHGTAKRLLSNEEYLTPQKNLRGEGKRILKEKIKEVWLK